MVIVVRIDKTQSCLKVTEHGGFVEPPFSDNPALPKITALNETPVSGPSVGCNKLHVTGTGFWPGGKVQISVKNAPGLSGLQKIASAVGTADKDGNVTIDVAYSTAPYGGLPGCAYSSTSTVNITVIATDETSDLKSSTLVNIRNCNIEWAC